MLAVVFLITAVLLLLFIEGLLPFQDPAVGWARSRAWTSWLAHVGAVMGLASLWWISGGDAWGGVIFGNALNLGHEAGQKLYGDLPWANLDTAMDLLLPLAVSVGAVWWWERRRAWRPEGRPEGRLEGQPEGQPEG